jgi:hypothetical protein
MPDPRRCDRGGHDHGGDREGTCGDPFGLRWTTSRRPRPATTRRRRRTDLMPRRGRQILVWAPGEDGPNLRRTTPKHPVRVTGGRTRLLPADWALGVISAPRNSRGFPESRSRESRPTTRRPLEPHRRNGGWRHPPPSGSPSGPVSPSGRNSNPDFPVQPRRPLGATFYVRSPGGGRQGNVAAGQTHMSSSCQVELLRWNLR